MAQTRNVQNSEITNPPNSESDGDDDITRPGREADVWGELKRRYN